MTDAAQNPAGQSPAAETPVARRRLFSPAVEAALWTCGSSVFFSAMFGLIRLASDELHALQIVFFRNFFALLILLPFVLHSHGMAAFRTKAVPTYLLRGGLEVVAMSSWFTALTLMPLADVVALGFTGPLFGTIGAAIFLHEVVRLRRWSATVIGFFGAIIITQPWSGFGENGMSPYAFLVLISAAFGSMALLVTKVLSRTEPPQAIVTWMVLVLTPVSLIPALAVWQTPSIQVLAIIFLVSSMGSLAHICVTRGLQLADASALMPYKYTNLPVTALIGWVAYEEVVGANTWIGAGIIALSSIYIAHREAQVSAERNQDVRKAVPAPMVEASRVRRPAPKGDDGKLAAGDD